MNFAYTRMFKVGTTHILNFISLAENFGERRLVRGFSVIYDTTNRVFSSTVDFESGDDYKLFHNIAVVLLPGIRVEE